MSRDKEPRVRISPEWVTLLEPLKMKNPQGWYEIFSGCTKEALGMIDKYQTEDAGLQALYLRTKIIKVTDKRRTGQINILNKVGYGKKSDCNIA